MRGEGGVGAPPPYAVQGLLYTTSQICQSVTQIKASPPATLAWFTCEVTEG